MGPLQWGDVPTAVAAVFAGGAAWFAYQTIKSQRQQIGEQRQFIGEQLGFMAEQRQNLELERVELRAAAEDRRWAQARQVRMYPNKAGWEPDGRGGGIATNDHWVVTVDNNSDAPIHQVDVRFGTAYRAAEACEWPVNRRYGDRAVSPGEPLPRPVFLLGPAKGARFTSPVWSAATAHNNRPTLFFMDDSGVQWSLDSDGKLEETPADGTS
ncbi:hypothetical protein PV735_05360 [Streptomyces turgidiscabies]|uniref:hypothetical protein n=1 Tax=Streptomyces turgidiscabies TaxID=85558 RepID=UPI0005C89EE7|nr:hypothetical protein [Streptomyces turgidiscabies]MDX3492117.1 hypothetical protein [Streptomyces turgidiscabies]